MLKPSDSEIDTALGLVQPGLEKYRWIQERARSCDVTSDVGLQQRFKGSYRIRRDATWYRPYFRLLENTKAEPIAFSNALRILRERTAPKRRSPANSFTSWIPRCPSSIASYSRTWGSDCRTRTPLSASAAASSCTRSSVARYRALEASPLGHQIRERFDRAFPGSGVSDLKKIDLVLWQHRGPS